jgi:hypothetical protein
MLGLNLILLMTPFYDGASAYPSLPGTVRAFSRTSLSLLGTGMSGRIELHCVSRPGRRTGDNLYSLPSGRKLFNSRHVKKQINQDDESVLSNSRATDSLPSAIAEADHSAIQHTILAYDGGFWSGNWSLYNEVQKTNWDDSSWKTR